MSDIVIIDYGVGNLFNVVRACQFLGIHASMSSSPDRIAEAQKIILPGVGAFGQGMENLRSTGIDQAIHTLVQKGGAVLGICLGMQLLLSESEEYGIWEGLDLIPGRVVRLKKPSHPKERFTIPHTGWNSITPPDHTASHWESTLFHDCSPHCYMYFVHSYHARVESSDHCLAVTTYGENTFCSAVQMGRVFGCQFHPERSGLTGLSILSRFASL